MLNENQLDFLKTEFSLDKKAIDEMTIEQWREIRMKCFDIEGDEAIDAAENDSVELSERGEHCKHKVSTAF